MFLKQAQVSFLFIAFAKKILDTPTALMVSYLKECWFSYMEDAHKSLGLPNANRV